MGYRCRRCLRYILFPFRFNDIVYPEICSWRDGLRLQPKCIRRHGTAPDAFINARRSLKIKQKLKQATEIEEVRNCKEEF